MNDNDAKRDVIASVSIPGIKLLLDTGKEDR